MPFLERIEEYFACVHQYDGNEVEPILNHYSSVCVPQLSYKQSFSLLVALRAYHTITILFYVTVFPALLDPEEKEKQERFCTPYLLLSIETHAIARQSMK